MQALQTQNAPLAELLESTSTKLGELALNLDLHPLGDRKGREIRPGKRPRHSVIKRSTILRLKFLLACVDERKIHRLLIADRYDGIADEIRRTIAGIRGRCNNIDTEETGTTYWNIIEEIVDLAKYLGQVRCGVMRSAKTRNDAGDSHNEFLPADHYKLKFDISASRLAKARMNGRLSGEKRGGRWFYQESAVQHLWPDVFI